MNKPLTMIIEETKMKLTEVCNGALKSGLAPVALDLIVQSIGSEIHSLADRQTLEDKIAYLKAIKDENVGICSDSGEVKNEVRDAHNKDESDE